MMVGDRLPADMERGTRDIETPTASHVRGADTRVPGQPRVAGALDRARALQAGARAAIATPRRQHPTGAAIDAERRRELRTVLERHPEVLVVEDDYVAHVAGAPYVSVHPQSGAGW